MPADFEDCNGKGLSDECEVAEGTSADCNENFIPDECDIADGTSADCNYNGIPDECDIADATSVDCDGNGIPDGCEVLFVVAESGELSPIGAGSPQSFTIAGTSEAGSDVTFSFTAIGDFVATNEFVDVDINGVPVGTVFMFGASDCPAQPDADQLILSAEAFNEALPDPVINMMASSAVDPNLCSSFIAVTVEYQATTVGDMNGDGIIDACECPADLNGDGAVDAFDLAILLGAWCSAVNDPNPPSPPCENCFPENLAFADISGPASAPDGCVDAFDLTLLLGNWGPCP
ncbi:MAG: hypothetical protein IH889_05690 [Planctomycetes bacterium]|nr:hypothetical protein [Planctomycetota bacterium]